MAKVQDNSQHKGEVSECSTIIVKYGATYERYGKGFAEWANSFGAIAKAWFQTDEGTGTDIVQNFNFIGNWAKLHRAGSRAYISFINI